METSLAEKLRRVLSGLKRYYLAPQVSVFRHFRNGLMYFAFGLIVIFLGHQSLEASLRLELVTLFGLMFVALGFGIALSAYWRLLVGRIIRFFSQK